MIAYLCLLDALALDSCYETGRRGDDGRLPEECLGRCRAPVCEHEVRRRKNGMVGKGSLGLTSQAVVSVSVRDVGV